jgi:hypothetical protein
MKWLSYAWAVITGVVSVVIALAVINHFNESFERVVVDLLVMIYVTVRGGVVALANITIEQAKLDRNRYLALMKATGDTEFQRQDYQAVLAEDDETMAQAKTKVIINSVFLTLVWLAAMLNLIGAL